MPRLRPSAAVALAALSLFPAVALAHQGNPNYRSTILTTPTTKGFHVTVQNFDDSLSLENNTGQPVTVFDYDGAPYVQLLPDGTVQRNLNSAATYVNDERDGSGTVPANVKPGAAPNWQTLDKSGRYAWHDHRIHYMGTGLPIQVQDKGKKAHVFDWKVPVQVGATPAAITGSLDWVPRSDGGPPVGAFVGFGVLLLLSAGAVITVRRRRGEEGDPDAAASEPPKAEAW